MTTCRDIITRGMQELGVLALGEQPTAAEADAGMARLSGSINGAFGNSVGETLTETTVATDATMSANRRYVVSGRSAAITLTLPATPDNGARVQVIDADGTFDTYSLTIARNGRKLEGAAANLTLTTEGLSRTWFYRADLGDWKRISDLTLNDDLPFPAEHEDAFALDVAMRLGPVFGATLSPESAAAHTRATKRLRAAYRQRVVVQADLAVLNLSTQAINPRMSVG